MTREDKRQQPERLLFALMSASSPPASQSLHLVLCEGSSRVARYSSLSEAMQRHKLLEPSAACSLSAGPAVLHRADDSPPGSALQPAAVSYGGDPSGRKESRKAAASLLRTAVQKAVRRRQALAAAALAVQYFRQLSMPGAKGVNAERAAFCKRLFVVAAEDSTLVKLLAAAGWHALAATKGMGFGKNDARVVAECAGRLAEVGRGLGGGAGGEDGGGGEGEKELKLFVAEIAQGERGSAEKGWLEEVGERRVEEGEVGANVKEEARRAVEETHYQLKVS